jgi:hypothetical protein
VYPLFCRKLAAEEKKYAFIVFCRGRRYAGLPDGQTLNTVEFKIKLATVEYRVQSTGFKDKHTLSVAL